MTLSRGLYVSVLAVVALSTARVEAGKTCACSADANVDYMCNNNDFTRISSCAGGSPVGVCAPADVDCDGDVDATDGNIVNCRIFEGSPVECCGACGCHADFNRDGAVTEDDLSIYDDESEGNPCVFDVNCDEVVNDSDREAVLCQIDGCSDCCNPNPGLYGDTDDNGVIDIDDVLCVLDCFVSGTCPNGDIWPCGGGDKVCDLDDILAILDTFQGFPPCPCPE